MNIKMTYNDVDITTSAFVDDDGIKRPSNWARNATQEELDSLGVIVTIVPEPEPIEESIESVKFNLIENIKNYRDYLILNGGHKIGNSWFHSNEISLIQQLVLDGMAKQMAAAGAEDSASLSGVPAWKTMGGEFVTLTVGIAKSFVVSAMTQQGLLFIYAQNMIDEITSSNDKTYLLSYNYKTNFPETYINNG